MSNSTPVFCTECFWTGRRLNTTAFARQRIKLDDAAITRKPCPYCFKRVTTKRADAGYHKLRRGAK